MRHIATIKLQVERPGIGFTILGLANTQQRIGRSIPHANGVTQPPGPLKTLLPEVTAFEINTCGEIDGQTINLVLSGSGERLSLYH